MIKDDVIFASDERRNAVGRVFHVFSWYLFGGDMLPHNSNVADLVGANGFLIDSKSRNDSCGFLHPERQLMAHEASFPQAVLYADWGWVGRYQSRRRKANGQRKRLSALKNMRNTRQLVQYLSQHTTQLYIIDGSILAQMCRRAKRGRVKGVGKKKLKPHLTDAYYGERSLTVCRSLLQAICADPKLLKIYGLSPDNFVAYQEKQKLDWVMAYVDDGDRILYEDLLCLELDVYYIVRSTWLPEIQAMIAGEREYHNQLVQLFRQNQDTRTTVPF